MTATKIRSVGRPRLGPAGSGAVRAIAGRDQTSAGGVEEPGHQRALGQAVADPDRVAGLGHMDGDRTLLQVAAGARVNLQPLVHALGEHDDGRSAGHEFRDVGGLDARRMPGPGFGPVPGAAAARVELEVLAGARAPDLHAAPAHPGHPGWPAALPRRRFEGVQRARHLPALSVAGPARQVRLAATSSGCSTVTTIRSYRWPVSSSTTAGLRPWQTAKVTVPWSRHVPTMITPGSPVPGIRNPCTSSMPSGTTRADTTAARGTDTSPCTASAFSTADNATVTTSS